MIRKILSLILILCLLSGCGTLSPRPAAVPALKNPCCPIAEQGPVVRELPDDKQGDYVVVTVMLPREVPKDLFGPDGAMTLFTAKQFNIYPDLHYKWDGKSIWREEGSPPKLYSAEAGTEYTITIPFRESITFHTTRKSAYDNSMKVSAAFHYKDGRAAEASYAGLASADIELTSDGTIVADQNSYAYADGQKIDVTASYQGIDTDVTQILQGKQESLYCKVQLLHGRLASEYLSDCTLTVSDPAGEETVTAYTGEEIREHYWAYEDYDYCTLSFMVGRGLQIEDAEGTIFEPSAEADKISSGRTVYRCYYPGAQLGPVYDAMDVSWRESFLFTFSLDGFCWWAGVTYKSPEGQKGTLCVSGIPNGTAELFRDGTAVLEGDLSEFKVFYIPPGEETVLSLTGKGQEQVTVRYENGTLAADGTGLEYTVEETDISAMPFDPNELPAIIGWL